MKVKRNTYSFLQASSAIVMVLALLWLTVSTPFVYASQQEFAKHNKAANSNVLGGAEEETSNAPGNTTEEKKPSGGNSVSEEYLHDNYIDDHFISPIAQFHKCENAGVYTAFHGEVQVPPPNVA